MHYCLPLEQLSAARVAACFARRPLRSHALHPDATRNRRGGVYCQTNLCASAATMTGSGSLIRRVQADLASGRCSAVQLTQRYIQRIQETDGQIRAVLKIDEAAALAQARIQVLLWIVA